MPIIQWATFIQFVEPHAGWITKLEAGSCLHWPGVCRSWWYFSSKSEDLGPSLHRLVAKCLRLVSFDWAVLATSWIVVFQPPRLGGYSAWWQGAVETSVAAAGLLCPRLSTGTSSFQESIETRHRHASIFTSIARHHGNWIRYHSISDIIRKGSRMIDTSKGIRRYHDMSMSSDFFGQPLGMVWFCEIPLYLYVLVYIYIIYITYILHIWYNICKYM